MRTTATRCARARAFRFALFDRRVQREACRSDVACTVLIDGRTARGCLTFESAWPIVRTFTPSSTDNPDSDQSFAVSAMALL
jgi:hypothetical protein